MSTLELKLQMTALFIQELEDEDLDLENESGRLHSVLTTYRQMLLRAKHRTPTDFDDLAKIKHAIRECGSLLVDLGISEPEKMRDWSHGVTPTNRAMALANMLSRLILEFSFLVGDFEDAYPELKHLFDRERVYHASLIN